MDEELWDERYGATDRVWSGEPNVQLVAETAGLAPGRALDVGCGEGADAIWLAARGWQVTGVDFSRVALSRAAAHARQMGAQVSDRLTWLHANLIGWQPPSSAFDLVTAHYMHLMPADRSQLYGRLATAVSPGGVLLIVGHDVSDLQTAVHRPHNPDLYFSAADLAAALDPNRWQLLVCDSRPRTVAGPDGPTEIKDAVLAARRR